MSPDTDPHDHHHAGDSAGVPGRGGASSPTAHAGDDGSADPALLAALTAFRDGDGDQVAVVDAYRTARLLIPLVAEKGDEGVGAHGLTVDKTQELSIVTVAAPDGRTRAAGVHVGRGDGPVGCRRPAGAGRRRAHRPRGVGRRHRPDRDRSRARRPSSSSAAPRCGRSRRASRGSRASPRPRCSRGCRRASGESSPCSTSRVEAGDPTGRLRGPELVVRLELIHGLEQAELDAVLGRLARRWAADDRIAVLVDSLTVKLVRA